MKLRDLKFQSFLMQELSQEPVGLAEVKSYLRVYHIQDDDLIKNVIRTARAWCEHYCNRSFIACRRQWIANDFPEDDLFLSYGLVRSIESISYYDVNDVAQNLSLSSVRFTPNARQSIIQPKASFPSVQRGLNAVTITYLAGPEPDALVPPETVPKITLNTDPLVKSAILLLSQHFYDNRTLFISGSVNEIPLGVQSLLSPLVIHKFY